MFLIPTDFWEVKLTKNKGRGVFAKKLIPSGTIIGDYIGTLVNYFDFDFEKEKENLYLMYYNDTYGIYPDLSRPGVYLLNHACNPNCWLYNFKGHTLVFALKDIIKNSELTISYLLPPNTDCNPCTHICKCKSKTCTKSMHLSEEKYKKWQAFQKEEKIGNRINKNELKPLAKYPEFIPESYISKIKKLNLNSH